MKGHVVHDRLPAGLADDTAGRRAIGDALVDVLAALHRIDPAEVGLGDYGRPEGFVQRQVGRWSRQWEASEDVAVPAVGELAEQLGRTVPISSAAGIVHGDYRLDNCIVDLQNPGRIAAVLDWELPTLGDPLTDLGMLLFYWSDAAGVIPTLIQTVFKFAVIAAGIGARVRAGAMGGQDSGDLRDEITATAESGPRLVAP